MSIPAARRSRPQKAVAAAFLACAAVAVPSVASAWNQDATPNGSPHAIHAAQDSSEPLASQLHELRAKVAQLEAALKEKQAPSTTTGGGMAGMGMGAMQSGRAQGGMNTGGMEGGETPMMGGMGSQGMSGMGMGMDGMGMMSKGGMGMMSGMGSMQSGQGGSGMGGMSGMGMMGRMPGTGQMQMPSALPGFPGASHIYHIGATGFFLDHAGRLALTGEQQAGLNRIKEKSLRDRAAAERAIEEAEQELWTLTASDQPDAAKIEATVRKIDELGGDNRLAFIRAVGDAAELLTEEQRQSLLGSDAPDPGGVDRHDPSN
ncbi:periplasmic heavy metal sensor [Alienimonas sp. DA493]|uniref:periplasmic heavy metal sensor n=1 Tax=Alienimonas sp. DA493 TaxID=3373605 RepID=UPI00375487E8